MGLFDFFFGGMNQAKSLVSLSQIESRTKNYMAMPLESLKQEHKMFTAMAKDATEKGRLIGEIYQSQSRVKIAEITANLSGAEALAALQSHESKYRSLKQKLLAAAKT
jgi:hypothetical protein